MPPLLPPPPSCAHTPHPLQVSVADVAKAMGEKWGGMTEEEKGAFKELAAQRAQEAQGAVGAAAGAVAPLRGAMWCLGAPSNIFCKCVAHAQVAR